ncbi:putative FAD-dependent oxygenase [Aspergillus sclerotioniger CBS 115572]|uniref:Putative FAD-dependent oxygenase n=1 Tax=Aspergillus sclerotioniger CBS 115572 TaxID=1450535 RepID=A0A317X159_9EURO|nr:putative FAD-dependent oxygenase [Aspergillus sclerotioniger CBS 115572]PWY90260.1 putative FAD-dependent oxygenase [Aspergillus sclerotioniger CBS 115572]
MAGWKVWIISVLFAVLLTERLTDAIAFRREDITTLLGPQLSVGAQIILPNNAGFVQATQRWSLFDPPHFTAVVEVGTEEDVATTVKFANQNNIPFLAVTGTHGTITSLGKFNGIEIRMRNLNSTVISEDGKTVTLGGGKRSGEVIEALWAAGKQTVSGICECTGFLGPALGGGHGILQGKYGIVSDQFVSMRMVTADGAIREVSPTGPNSDLWWAMQGAGHNFGIVTFITLKVYDVPDGGLWSYESYVFSHDKVEAVFETINWLAQQQPPGMFNRDVIYRNPSVDPTNPILQVDLLQESVSAVATKFTSPFRKLGPMSVRSGSGTYKDIPTWAGVNVNSIACNVADTSKIRFPIGLVSYNATAQRALMDTFTQTIGPDSPFNVSQVLFEGYSMYGVRAGPDDAAAFPHRGDNQLVTVAMVNKPSPELDAQAVQIGNKLRQELLKGSGSPELHAYVNYASGTESLENLYGFEPWRLKRLKELKAKYDPQGRFGYYAPIPV